MKWLVDIDAFLAQSVMTADGSLQAIGAGWSVIEAPSVPYFYPRVGIGTILTVANDAPPGLHRVEIQMVLADGSQVDLGPVPNGPRAPGMGRVQADLYIEEGREDAGGTVRTVCLAFNLDGLVFRQYGQHRFIVSLDGENAKTVRFDVRRPFDSNREN